MYDRLTTEEKVHLDTYLAYATNSLYFMCVKLRGAHPKDHDITKELHRVRHVMERTKLIHENKTLRPRLDKGAAGRFIKHSLPKYRRFQENASDDEMQQETREGVALEQAPAKNDMDIETGDENKQSSKFITESSKLIAAGGESSCDGGDDDNEENFIADT